MAVLPLQLARVSNSLRTFVATNTLATKQQQLLEVQNQLATGKRVNAPSDDPGASAIIQQLQKTLEQRDTYAANLKAANDGLGEVDTTLGTITDLLRQAQTVASANFGSDVTDQERQGAAAVIDSIYRQVFDLSNHQFQGTYIFGGDRAPEQPFVEQNGFVQFVGSERTLHNVFDEGTDLAFQVDGANVFGALADRVKGRNDIGPSVAADTRIGDLDGASSQGVRPGTIRISNGTITKDVDLTTAGTLGEVVTLINAAGVGGITASLSGSGIQLSASASDNITVLDDTGGTTAADLGIRQTVAAGAGVNVVGQSTQPRVTPLTPVSLLNGGTGIDLAGITITNGTQSAAISFSGVVTVEDLLNKITAADVGVRAQINAAGTGIDVLNNTQGPELRISENGTGTTATQLGLITMTAQDRLADLNSGHGVQTSPGSDLEISSTTGVKFQIDIDGAGTVQDVIDRINIASLVQGAGVTASFSTSGGGIVLTDTGGGGAPLFVTSVNASGALVDLGLDVSAVGDVVNGRDVNPALAGGVFANLGKLRDALRNNDQNGITAAAESLQLDNDRVIRVRGETGARVQEFDARAQRLEDQNVATKALLSSMQDVDFTEAISRFQTLQTSLQATLQTAGRMLDQSLLDFLR